MHVACGIAVSGENILICKRVQGGAYAGRWEFPTAVLDAGETLEESLERSFFERLSLNLEKFGCLGAFDSVCARGVRVHAFRVKCPDFSMVLLGYDDAKWVHIKKLERFPLIPDAVTLVKVLQKNIVFFPQ